MLLLLSIVFCYFRLKPIYLETIPYTFDQGRDFLRAEEIVRDHNLTFIGPTTGIQGLFHGAWWYYFLAIPYIIFQGNPNGFVMFMFLSALAQFVLFSIFLKKKFDMLVALVFASTIAVSPYFIAKSFFAINSVMTFPFILLFFFSSYAYLEEKKLRYLFLLFLSLGFIFEFEVAFGLMIIPAVCIAIILSRQLKSFFPHIKSAAVALVGLLIPFIPRGLFEIKNGFMEVKTLWHLLFDPKFFTPKTFEERLIERSRMFSDYYFALFPDYNQQLGIIVAVVVVLGIIVGYKKFSIIQRNFFKIIGCTFVLLFILSLFYRDSFWSNYYEGLSYFYALFIVIGMYGLLKAKLKLPTVYIGAITLTALFMIVNDIKAPLATVTDGYVVQKSVVESVYKLAGQNELCVRVYTPPVIPYTYDYLFSYYSQHKGVKHPSLDFVNGQCYFIVEKERGGGYNERIVKWRRENTPKDATLEHQEEIYDTVALELWKEK